MRIKLRDYKGENKIFKQQQQGAYNQIGSQTDLYRSFTQDASDMMWARFGQQSQIFNMLQDNLNASSMGGPGSLNPNANDFFRENGFLPGEEGQGGAGGGGGSFQERVARARAERESGGGGGSASDWQAMSGYDPSIFDLQFTPRRFYQQEGAALRSQLSEEATNSYGDAEQAFGQRALQMGGYGPGIEAAALRDLNDQKAAAQMEGQRKAILFGAQNIRDDMRAFAGPRTQLALGKADALAREAGMQNQIMAQKAAQAEAARARAAASRAAGAASRQAQQQWSASQRQRASEFAAEMKLKGAQFNSENFFRSIGAMSGLAGMADPQGYMSGILGGLGGPNQAYGNIYNTGSQGMVNTASNPLWGQLLGGAVGGGLSFLTGGLNNMMGGQSFMGGSRGGGQTFGGGGSSYQPPYMW